MKVSREQAAENRARVVDAAARLYRERGFDGVGIAELMRGAGLTHGGFYASFDSKEALMAEALAKAAADTVALWSARAAAAPRDKLQAVVGPYLSPRHRDRPGEGCLVAALGAEAARRGGTVRRAVTEGVDAMTGALAAAIPGKPATRRAKALATFAQMVGALVLARAVADPALSEEILTAVRASLLKG